MKEPWLGGKWCRERAQGLEKVRLPSKQTASAQLPTWSRGREADWEGNRSLEGEREAGPVVAQLRGLPVAEVVHLICKAGSGDPYFLLRKEALNIPQTLLPFIYLALLFKVVEVDPVVETLGGGKEGFSEGRKFLT